MKLVNSSIIKINKEKTSIESQGSFGVYLKLNSKRGLKIVSKKSFFEKFKGFSNLQELKKDHKYLLRVFKEVWLLNQASPSKISPRKARLQIVEFKENGKKTYFAAIIMEHVQGKSLNFHNISLNFAKCNDSGRISPNGTRVVTFIKKKMKLVDISYLDIHGENILLHRNKIKIIDFTPLNYCCSSLSTISPFFKEEFNKVMTIIKKIKLDS